MMTSCVSPQEAAKELLVRRRARANIHDYVSAIQVPGRPVEDESEDIEYSSVAQAKHHTLLLEFLERVSERRHGRGMIFMPPGSAKSTYASVVFPSMFLGQKQGRKLILATYGDDLARKMGRRTRGIVQQPRYQGIWGVELASDSKAAQEFALTNGSEYMACGIRSGITGNRAHGIIIDDPIKGREQADSEIIRQATWDAYEDDLKTRLIPGGWIFIIQTRWHEDDLAGRILPDGWSGESGLIMCKDGNEWEVLCLQAQCQREDDPLGREQGEYLWPEWFDERHWDQFKPNQRTWSALYQQIPRPPGGAEFKREWLCSYGEYVDARDMTKVILVDAASGKNPSRGDYTSMWVIGVAGDGNRYVLDMVRDRLNLTGRTDALFRLHRKWRPQQVRYEEYGMQADIEHIQGEMVRRVYRFQIIQVGGKVKKEDRIRRLIPRFQSGGIWFPTTLPYTGVDGVQRDLVHDFVEQEMLPFPVGSHDDMLDALARMEEPGVVIPEPMADMPIIGPGQIYQPTVGSMGY